MIVLKGYKRRVYAGCDEVPAGWVYYGITSGCETLSVA